VKPLARKVSDADLRTRRELDARAQALLQRAAELEQAMADNRDELAKAQGARDFWRETVIDPKYRMTPADYIEDDGTIVRAEQ
jgi:hypothetical protein